MNSSSGAGGHIGYNKNQQQKNIPYNKGVNWVVAGEHVPPFSNGVGTQYQIFPSYILGSNHYCFVEW